MRVSKITGVYYLNPNKKGFNELTAFGMARRTTLFCNDKDLIDGGLYDIWLSNEYEFSEITKNNQPIICCYYM